MISLQFLSSQQSGHTCYPCNCVRYGCIPSFSDKSWGTRFRSIFFTSHVLKINFIFLSLSSHILLVNIADGTVSSVLGKGIIHAISSLALNNVLYVLKFFVSLLSISQIPKIKISCHLFSYLFCVSGPLVWDEAWFGSVVFTIWMMVHPCLA